MKPWTKYQKNEERRVEFEESGTSRKIQRETEGTLRLEVNLHQTEAKEIILIVESWSSKNWTLKE